MRWLVEVALRHRVTSIGLTLLWIASWVPIFALWTTGIEPWMVGIRYVVLLIIGAFVAVGVRAPRTASAQRAAIQVTAFVAIIDVIALFMPDLVAGLRNADPWWGFVEAGIFLLVFGTVWVVLGATAGILGSRIGLALSARSSRRPHPGR